MQNGRRRMNRRRFGTPAKREKITYAKGREVQYAVLGYDRVWFTKHALVRMKQRGVTQEEVFSVLENPTQENIPTAPATKRWRKERRNKKSIDVVFKFWSDKVAIITVIKI